MVGFSISYIRKLLEKYGEQFPRKTEITTFSEVVARKVALSNLTLVYNRSTGFLGHLIKTEDEDKDISIQCSEYDRILLIFSTGIYKVIPVTEKLFVGSDDKHARVSFVPSQRARSNVLEIDFAKYLIKNAGAKGKRVSTRVVRRVVESTDRVLKERVNLSLPGMEVTDDTSDQDENLPDDTAEE